MPHERGRPVQHPLLLLNPAMCGERAHVHADDPIGAYAICREKFDHHHGGEQAAAATSEYEHAQQRVDAYEVTCECLVVCTASLSLASLDGGEQRAAPEHPERHEPRAQEPEHVMKANAYARHLMPQDQFIRY